MNFKKSNYVFQGKISEKTNFLKKISILLSIILVLGTFPTKIYASTCYFVGTVADLAAAMGKIVSGEVIMLTKDITIDNDPTLTHLSFPAGQNIELDLVGHNLTIKPSPGVDPIMLGSLSTLTIQNSIPGSQAKLDIQYDSSNSNPNRGAGINMSDSNLTLKDVIVKITPTGSGSGRGIGGGYGELMGLLTIENSALEVSSIGNGPDSNALNSGSVKFISGNLVLTTDTTVASFTDASSKKLYPVNIIVQDETTRSPIAGAKVSFDSRSSYTNSSGIPAIYSTLNEEKDVFATHTDYIDNSEKFTFNTVNMSNTFTMLLKSKTDFSAILSSLSLTEGGKPVTLSPALDPFTLYYTASVLPSVTEVTVNAIPVSANATVKLNNPYKLSTPPTNTTTVGFTVTAKYGNNENVYRVLVTKVPVSAPQITPTTGVIGQDLVLTFANANATDLVTYMAGITSIKYNGNSLIPDNNATNGLNKYKISGNSVTIFKENITTSGNIPIEFLNRDANLINFNVNILESAITNPTITTINSKLNQDLILELSNSNLTDLTKYLNNISTVAFGNTTLARDDSASSGFGKYKIDTVNKRIIIFKENITSLGSKIVTVTAPNAVTQAQTHAVNILSLAIQNPTIKNTNGLLNKDLVIYLENTDSVALNNYMADITGIKYGASVLTRDNSALSGLNKYRIDGNKITIFKENITSLGSRIVTVTAPNAVTQAQTCSVNIISSAIQNPAIKNTNGLLNKDLVIYLENTDPVALNNYMADITGIKYGASVLTRDNSVLSGLNKYRIDGNKITIFKENITSLGSRIVTVTAPNAVTQSQTCTVNILSLAIQNPTIKNTNGLLNKDLVIYLENTDPVALNNYMADITSVMYGSSVLTRDNSALSGLNKYRIDGNKITIFKENITSTGNYIVTIIAPNANLIRATHNVYIYLNSDSIDNGSGSSSQGSSSDKTYEPSKIYSAPYTLKTIDDKYKSDPKGYTVVNYLDVSYKLPNDIIDKVVGLRDYIYKHGYSLSDLSIRVNIETLSTNERNNLNRLYNEKFKGELVSNPYKISLSLLDKNGNVIDFDMSSFVAQITFTLKTTKQANTVLKYDMKNEILSFTPSILRTNIATVNTRNHSIYVAAKNNSSFLDVNVREWFYSQVINAANKGLVFGVGNNIYQPNREVTRAEFVQMMVKAVQVPEYVSNTREYRDVSYGEWFYDPIMRAKSYGMLDSFNNDSFTPNQPITREEMASILAVAVVRGNITVPNQNVNLNSVFTDTHQISSSRLSDIELVYKLRIMQGMDNGTFSPKGYTTRAQAATVQLNILRKSGAIEN